MSHGEPLPAPELEQAAHWLVDRGLAAPAVLFLELHRPLAHLSAQAAIVGGGLLAPLLGLERFRAFQQTLADADAYRAFLDRVEGLARTEEPS